MPFYYLKIAYQILQKFNKQKYLKIFTGSILQLGRYRATKSPASFLLIISGWAHYVWYAVRLFWRKTNSWLWNVSLSLYDFCYPSNVTPMGIPRIFMFQSFRGTVSSQCSILIESHILEYFITHLI